MSILDLTGLSFRAYSEGGSFPPAVPYFVFTKGNYDNTLFYEWTDVWRVPCAGGATEQLTDYSALDTNDCAWPTISPNYEKICFAHFLDSGGNSLTVMNSDGTSVVEIDTPSDDNGIIEGLQWHVYSNKIIYSVQYDNFPSANNVKIWIINIDGTNKTELADLSFPMLGFAYNNTGTKLAYISSNTLYVADADGSNATAITGTGVGSGSNNNVITWLHDSDVIIYASGSNDVRKINADGTGDTLISTASINHLFGYRGINAEDTKLFNSQFSTGWLLRQINIDGSAESVITPNREPFHNANFPVINMEGRIYIIEQAGLGNLVSILEDGTDYRTEETAISGGPFDTWIYY